MEADIVISPRILRSFGVIVNIEVEFDGGGIFRDVPNRTGKFHRLQCGKCKHKFSVRGRLRKIVPNPLARILDRLAEKASREPQLQELELLPETL